MVDVVNRLFHAVHHPHVKDVIVVFGEPVLLRGPPDGLDADLWPREILRYPSASVIGAQFNFHLA